MCVGLYATERKARYVLGNISPNSTRRAFTGSQSVFICLTGKNTANEIESRQRGNKSLITKADGHPRELTEKALNGVSFCCAMIHDFRVVTGA